MTTNKSGIFDYGTVASTIDAITEEGIQPKMGTVGILTFPKDIQSTNNFKLKTNMIAEVRLENGNYIALDYEINEYGIGESPEEAGQDLLESLGDYLISLERREPRLASKELSKLTLIRTILAKV